VRRGSSSISHLGEGVAYKEGCQCRERKKKGLLLLTFGAREGARRAHSLAFEARVGSAAKKNPHVLALGARERVCRGVALSSCWSGDPLRLAFGAREEERRCREDPPQSHVWGKNTAYKEGCQRREKRKKKKGVTPLRLGRGRGQGGSTRSHLRRGWRSAAKRNPHAVALRARERGHRGVAMSSCDSCWNGDPPRLAFGAKEGVSRCRTGEESSPSRLERGRDGCRCRSWVRKGGVLPC